MQTKTKTKVIEYTVYVTNDGKEFEDKEKAQDHEKILNGDRKKCSECKGTGEINGRYEKITWDYGHSNENRWKTDICPKCGGKGYLEKTWI